MRAKKVQKDEPDFIFRDNKPVAVVIDIKKYQEMLEKIEDIEDIKYLKKMQKKKLAFSSFDELVKKVK